MTDVDETLVIFGDDGAPICSMSRSVFVKARPLANDKIEITLRQKSTPASSEQKNFKYPVSIFPHNKHLLRCLKWQ